MNTKSSGKQSRAMVITTSIMAVSILIPSLYGFAGKFFEFLQIFRNEPSGVFAITPILNYLFASLGFFCLLCWATMNGMFRNIEQPKNDMLENELRLDRQEGYEYIPEQLGRSH